MGRTGRGEEYSDLLTDGSWSHRVASPGRRCPTAVGCGRYVGRAGDRHGKEGRNGREGGAAGQGRGAEGG